MSPHTCFPCVRSEQRRQEKVTKEKATLHAASPPALRASGATCGARVQRGLARTRFVSLRSDNREP